MAWYTYILECSDRSFYVGITNNPKLRLSEHNAGKGALWTSLRRPVKLVYAEQHPDKLHARKREIEIKGWRRDKKMNLFLSDLNILNHLE
ncbi:MAG: GIY-YIG nuclease family protein [Verrucomicrobia bacterium]|nr:GIY-YIG nuclease family protein [Verrucomicrobiota bacterium]MBU1735813.1 GIY-YIG nuclease family protein [Verrucomicrobiota bacterium]MBU1858094.1 GIY-YIG nuclease family protein [Verrucomicrobiota bacterium]